jgi:SpoVK/Ycf46/Vps4 family AAA+-type ATPase
VQPGRLNHIVAMPLLSPASRQIVLRNVLACLLPPELVEEIGHTLIRVASDSSPGFGIADVVALGCVIAKKFDPSCMSFGNRAYSLSDIASSLASLTLADTSDQMQVIIASAVAQTRPSILRGLTSSGALPRSDPPVCAGIERQLSEISAVLRSVFDQDSTQVHSHLRRCSGLLLCGPSGCGKSVVARWIAASLANTANFIMLESPAILSAVVGDSEKALSSAFERARASAPSVLFIDKLEILGRVRGQDSTTEGTYDRLLATLLVEMDGVKQDATGSRNRQPVFFLASTEDSAAVDSALLRPGRFEHILVLQPPDIQQRAQVFRAILEKMAYSGDLEQDVHVFAQASEGWSMARISSACVAAALSALRLNPNAACFSSAHVIPEIFGAQAS